jgi:hypothetical protein
MAGGDLMFARRTGSFFSLAWFAGASLALVSFLLLVGESRAMELISAQEAGLPEDPSGRSYGISLGPAIIVLNPSPAAGFIRSPFQLKIRFQSYGGAEIGVDSILLTYKKVPPIDLTQRVRPFITSEQISIDNVEAPAGQHRIQVDLKDSRGHNASTQFIIKIRD